MDKNFEVLLKDMSFNTEYEFLEQGSNSELEEVAKRRGIKLPTRDLSFFKGKYGFVDRQNLNGCTLPKEEVELALDTIVGKSIDFDHYRSRIVGTWLEAKLVGNEIIAYGAFYKSNLEEDYDLIKKLMEGRNLNISFEAWGDRLYHDDGGYDLSNIEFAGGALLIKTDPAFPGAEVIELSNKKDKILEFAKVMTPPKEFIHGKEEKDKDKGDNVLVNAFAEISNEKDINFDLAMKFYYSSDEDQNKVPEEAAKWTRKFINDLPDSAFAVVEPAYKSDDTENKNARHLPHHSGSGDLGKSKSNANIDVTHYRNALARANQVKPVTDSISTESLRSKAASHLARHRDVLKTVKSKEEEKVDELLKKYEQKEDMDSVDFAKFLDAKIEEIKTEMASKDEQITAKDGELATANEKIETIGKAAEEAGVKVDDLKAEIETKVSKAREEAKTLTERKVELTEDFAKDMSDEDILNDDKFDNAKLKKELAAKDAELVEAKKNQKEDPEKANLEAGSKDKDKLSTASEIGKRVQARAYPVDKKE